MEWIGVQKEIGHLFKTKMKIFEVWYVFVRLIWQIYRELVRRWCWFAHSLNQQLFVDSSGCSLLKVLWKLTWKFMNSAYLNHACWNTRLMWGYTCGQ